MADQEIATFETVRKSLTDTEHLAQFHDRMHRAVEEHAKAGKIGPLPPKRRMGNEEWQPVPIWTKRVYASFVIVHNHEDGENYKVPYTDKDGKIALGDAKKVREDWVEKDADAGGPCLEFVEGKWATVMFGGAGRISDVRFKQGG